MPVDYSKVSGLLDGKTIVVTGSSSGIGARTALELKRHGATVIGVDINRNDDSAIDQFVHCDLGNSESISSAIGQIPNGIDGLCNIAGLPPTRPAPQVLRVNFVGLRVFTNRLVEKMSEGAAITNLASLAGIGWPDALPEVRALLAVDRLDDVDRFCDNDLTNDQPGRSYFLSKEALIVWTMQNRWTWRNRGIRMNCVSPGPVETPILQDFVETLGDRVEEDMRVMDRPGRPDDIAPLVAFLQSNGSNWLRGLNIPCDGGMSSHVVLGMHGMASEG